MKKLSAALLLISLVALPGIAKASFFDSGAWYMNASQWEQVGVLDAENRSRFEDGFDNLNWLANAPAEGNPASRTLASKWAFDLNQDFSFTVQYQYSHVGTFAGDEGGIELGLINPIVGETSRKRIKASNYYVMNQETLQPVNVNLYERTLLEPIARNNPNGTFFADYNAAADVLRLATVDALTGPVEETFLNVKSNLGASDLRVYFAGSSNLSTLGPNEAYFRGFTVNGGTMTPEPVSSALFLSGGLVFASRRLFRRNKKA